jgi:hypothetical protein
MEEPVAACLGEELTGGVNMVAGPADAVIS